MTRKTKGAARGSRGKNPCPTARDEEGLLDGLSPGESSIVLRRLLDRHAELRREAREIAKDLLSTPSTDAVADSVLAAVGDIGIEALGVRAGKKPWGYVGPKEAARELLGEAMEDAISDMKRRARLGLGAAAEKMCAGIVAGLYRAREVRTDGALAWVPGFPADEAWYAMEELTRACRAEGKKDPRGRVLRLLKELAPEWVAMLARTAAGDLPG